VEVVGAANIDVLFVNAGICKSKPISMIDEAFFDTLSTLSRLCRTADQSS
jgi:hypothetical protein